MMNSPISDLTARSEWTPAIARIQELVHAGDDEALELCFRDLASGLTPTYEKKNNDNINGLLSVLGFVGESGLDPIGTHLADYAPERGWKVAAIKQGKANLDYMLSKNYKFSNTFTREMVSIAWRDNYLVAFTSMVQDNTRKSIQTIIKSEEDKARFAKAMKEAGGESALANILDFQLWWNLLSQNKKAAKAGVVNGSDLFVTEFEARVKLL